MNLNKFIASTGGRRILIRATKRLTTKRYVFWGGKRLIMSSELLQKLFDEGLGRAGEHVEVLQFHADYTSSHSYFRMG